VNLGDFVLFIVLDGFFEFTYRLLETTSLSKNHANKIEDKRGWFYAFIKAFIEIIKGAVKISKSIV